MAVPSLAMSPSDGAKAGKLYSVFPTDGTGDLDFTRASSATRVNESGLIELVATGFPRLDYTGGGCPSLLLEPSRTNYINKSNTFVDWNLGGVVSRTANYGISPDGTLNSTRADFANGGLIFKSVNRPTSAYVFSVFAKNTEGSGSQIALRIDLPTSKIGIFDLSNGTIVSTTADDSKIEYYGNGWYRCVIIQNNDSIVNAVITEGATELGCELFGAMLEEGSYATSYIPTAGTTVTRAVDASTTTGISSVIGQTEGTIYSEFKLTEENIFTIIEINAANSTTNRILAYRNGSNIVFHVQVGNVLQIDNTTAFTFASINKVAVTYKANDFKIYANGSLLKAYTSGIIPSSLDTLAMLDINISNKKHVIRSLILYKTVLTDQELTALTTL
tara:strand:+ start:533 stop:1699 length:1167 start_codon:yes stop_codon:yes gene_type:complete